MNPILSPYVLIMLSAALICGYIIVDVWPHRRQNSETLPLIGLLSGIIEWILAALVGLLDQNLAHKLLWAKIEYFGVVFVPLALLGYVLHHQGSKQQLTVKRLVFLSAIPLLTLLLAWTNGMHNLVWASYVPYRAGGLVLSDKTYGPVFWVYWGYSYLLLLASAILTILPMLRAARLFRLQNLLVLAGILAPWIGNLLYVLHLNPFGDLDLTPLAFGLTGILLASGMFGWHLFDIKPVAQAAVIAGMPDGMLILDTRDRILDANPAALKILAMRSGELVGRPLEQVIPAWQSPLQTSQLTDGQCVDFKFYVGGEDRIYELSDSRFLDRRGSVGGRIVFLHDATARKQLEQKLKASERKHSEEVLEASEDKYQRLVTQIRDGIFITDTSGALTFANPGLARILGYEQPAQILGKRLPDFIVPARLPEVVNTFPQIVAGALSSVSLTTQLLRQDGNLADIEVTAGAQINHGQVVGVHGVIRDITEHKRAEEATLKSERRLRALVEHSLEEISLVDPHGDLIWESPTTTRPLGYPPESFVGQNLEQLIHPDDLSIANQLFAQTHAAPGNVSAGQFRLRHQDGSWRWMEAILTNLLEEPAVQAVVINYRDITERKQAEQQLLFRNAILTATQEGARDALLVVDGNSRIVSYNRRFIEMWALPPELVEQKLDQPVLDFVTNSVADPRAFVERVRWLYENPAQTAQEEILLKDGRIIDRYTAPMLGQDQVCYGRVWYFSDITGRRRSEQEIQRRLTDLQVLNDSLLGLGARNNPSGLAEKVLAILQQRLEWHHAFIRLRNAANELEVIGLSAASVTPENSAAEIGRLNALITQSGQGMSGWVVENGLPLRCGDLPSDLRYIETHPGLRSGLYAPMQVHDQVIGVIGVESELSEAFTADDERLLVSLANITANAIHNNQLHEQTENQLQRLAALRTIDQAISASFDLRITLNIFLKNALAQLGAEAALVLLVNPGLTALEFAAQVGLNAKAVREIRVRLGEGEVGRGILDQRLMWLQNTRQPGKPFVHPELAGSGDFSSCHVVPLIAKGQVKGALEVFHRTDIHPEPEWLEFLETLAGQAAIAVDNNHLFESLQRSNFELAIAYDETIQGWSNAVDLRDEVLEGHSARVTDLLLRLAGVMGVGPDEMIHMRRGALLHDIGKLGVPDKILRKPGPLNEVEWKVMRTHPQIAYDLLNPITYLRPALSIPYCHHEHWDGSGYPRGLKGDQIPLAARIFAVVDVWDSLTTDRPYRQAWSETQARQYILDGSGKQFDPHVVRKFLQELR